MSIIRRLKRSAKHHAHLGTHIRQDRWMRALWRYFLNSGSAR